LRVGRKDYIGLRVQNLEEENLKMNLFGLRYYRYIPNGSISFYFGGEISSFEYHSDCDINGEIIGCFAGIERYFFKNFSFNLDIGPYVAIGMIENVSDSLFDFVLNFSVNFYFGK